MTATPIDTKNSLTQWFFRLLGCLSSILRLLFLSLLIAWITLAVYYSNLPWAPLRLLMAVGVAIFSIWALFVTSRRRMGWAFAGLFLIIVIWFAAIRPSHERSWRREVAVMPIAVIEGDRLHITGVRNFDYRSETDFTERWQEREVSLVHLTSVDLFISTWKAGPIAHTFVSFNFDNAPPICISIETRPEIGEGFAPIASLFKQFELIYVVGEDRDIVGVRVNHRDEDVYLYPIRTTSEAARRLFLVYMMRINELAERPEWFHLLKNNCTVNIARYATVAGREGRWDYRHLLNRWVDSYLYDAGLIDTTLPLEELRRRSRINDAATITDDPLDFSRRIRESLPGLN